VSPSAAAARAAGAQCALFDLPPTPGGCPQTEQSEPDLTWYDYLLLSLSGGKDSQYTALTVARLARLAGVLERVVAVHAHLDEDHEDAEEYARMHAEAYGAPRFEVVRRDQTLLEHVLERGKWPSAEARYCTSDHKRAPIGTLMTRLADEADPKRLGRPVRILNVMGMRAEESTTRARREVLRHNKRETNLTRRHVDDWLPVHTASVAEVRAALDASGVPHHPAYDGDDGEPWAGCSRLSCELCVLASKGDLVLNARRNPARAQEYLRVEQITGHDFRADLSMAKIIDLANAGPPMKAH
jgi:3'-phosphoadenosine 5'-phosphosulfate sulfotransferase (PAPS reductase)/FAD synthetase